jgi:hypothetical protein
VLRSVLVGPSAIGVKYIKTLLSSSHLKCYLGFSGLNSRVLMEPG